MITIWKFNIDESGNEQWLFIHELESIQDLISDLEYLRQDGNIYRAEEKSGSSCRILEY